jgi:hypothetical protein
VILIGSVGRKCSAGFLDKEIDQHTRAHFLRKSGNLCVKMEGRVRRKL